MKKFAVLISLLTFLPALAHADQNTNNDITADIVVNKSVADAWKLWSTVGGLQSWLTPEAHIDLRLAGAYELYFDPQDHRDNNTAGCKITALIPQKLLAFEWKGPSSLAVMNSTPFPTWVIVSFELLDANTTIIHFRHSGWGAGAEWAVARDAFQGIWTKVFENLKK